MLLLSDLGGDVLEFYIIYPHWMCRQKLERIIYFYQNSKQSGTP